MTSPKVYMDIGQRKDLLYLYLIFNYAQDLASQKGNHREHGLVLSPPIQRALDVLYIKVYIE
jgi:hypothetical protein